MKKIAFRWKTVLNGICALLALSSSLQAQVSKDGPDSYQHDAYWASYDSLDRAKASAPVPKPYSGTTNAEAVPIHAPVGAEAAVPPPVYEYETTEVGVPEGLILHRFNQSPAAMAGSNFLGPGSFFANGWISQGLTYGSGGDYYSPMGLNDQEGYQMNQLYLSLGRRVEKGNQFSIGGQVDLMYGTDYYYMSSVGLETHQNNTPHWNGHGSDVMYRAGRAEYGAALPQAFGEIYMPFLNGLDFKVGHFNSVMGYESLQSNSNFFYSRSYTRIYGMPTSMTGAMGELALCNGWKLLFGGVTEWNAFDSPSDNFSGVLGLNYESDTKFFTFAITGMLGDQCAPCYQFETYAEKSQVFLLNMFAKFQIAPRLSYVCEFTVGNDDRDYFCLETFDMKGGRTWFGLNNYLFYQVNEQLTLGTRFEWFNDADSTIIDGGYGMAFHDGPSNYFALTLGANWTPINWISVRPEIRYDFSDFDCEGMKTYDNFTSDDQLTVGADVIVRF